MKSLLKWWIVIVAVYFGAVYSTARDVWPARYVVEILRYVYDNREAARSFSERVANDLGFRPWRLLDKRPPDATPGPEFSRLDIPGLAARRDAPHLFLSPERRARLLFVYGVLDLEKGLHGAFLLDETGKVVHTWALSENPDDAGSSPSQWIYPHGVLVDPDGAVTFTFDHGSSINKVDACGRFVWSRTGKDRYNHSLSRSADGTIWALAGQGTFDRINPATGAVEQRIRLGDIRAANPDLGIFSARRAFSDRGTTWSDDPFHTNDIEELSPAMAGAFPMFSAGDLLVSLRSLNLLFVFDPETLAVKWWMEGVTQQQHDPDWTARGTIAVLNNRWENPPSQVLEIDPKDNSVSVALDGATYGFHTNNRGKIQLFDGDMIVTSSRQGRVFEVDSRGKLVLDLRNTYDDEEGWLAVLSQAIALPTDYFREFPPCD